MDIILTAIGRWAPEHLAELAREYGLAVTGGSYELSPMFPLQVTGGCGGHAMPCTLITGTAVAFDIAVLLADKWREIDRGLQKGSSLLILRDGQPLCHVISLM
ncbi:hypothetical protein ACIBI3_11215 [Actinomadura luteofluorescens]|uniref:hypothetical protein n=1 Tax=Actinomadura luteofluorescens TaxID=46163 RepID=UPI0034898049